MAKLAECTTYLAIAFSLSSCLLGDLPLIPVADEPVVCPTLGICFQLLDLAQLVKV